MRVCSVPGCVGKHDAKGYCRSHYKKFHRTGDPLAESRISPGVAMSFIDDIAIPYTGDECLLWPFSKTPNGQGQINVNGKRRNPARIVCETAHGPAPSPKHEAAHTCGKGHLACIAKKHLYWATRKENEADKILHGTHGKKLSQDDAQSILDMKGSMHQEDIAAKFGVSYAAVKSIHARKIWRHLIPNVDLSKRAPRRF